MTQPDPLEWRQCMSGEQLQLLMKRSQVMMQEALAFSGLQSSIVHWSDWLTCQLTWLVASSGISVNGTLLSHTTAAAAGSANTFHSALPPFLLWLLKMFPGWRRVPPIHHI